MKTQVKKLSFRIYVQKHPRNQIIQVYPLNEDETQIDLENPLEYVDMSKYKLAGENNHFHIYQLKKQYC